MFKSAYNKTPRFIKAGDFIIKVLNEQFGQPLVIAEWGGAEAWRLNLHVHLIFSVKRYNLLECMIHTGQ